MKRIREHLRERLRGATLRQAAVYGFTDGLDFTARVLLRGVQAVREVPWHLRKIAVRLSNARYRATRPLRTVTGRLGNWRRRRFAETGKGYRAERATRRLRSSVPVYRDRVNPATGRPRRDDARIYAARDRDHARLREGRASWEKNYAALERHAAAWEHGSDAYRHVPPGAYASVAPRSRVRSR
jgi:hypothetical protein